MRVGGVVLARMGSERLPGKVLRRVGERTVLGHVLARLRRCRELDAVVVATSDQHEDDALATFCADESVEIFRGSLDDVAGRVRACARVHGLDALARVNADSPWLDPTLLDDAVRLIRQGDWDLVSNVRIRTWPYGIASEVLTTSALERICAATESPSDREHVTRYIYERPDMFAIRDLRSQDPSWAQVRLTVDTKEDFRRFSALREALGERADSVQTAELVGFVRSFDNDTSSSQEPVTPT